MQAADLVLMNGNGVDPWAEKLIEDLRSKKITVVRMSDDTNLAFLSGDPHFWLDPHLAQQIVRTIMWSLREFMVDAPEKESLIVEQGEAYFRRLTLLDQRYFEKLSSCERREIVTSHNAFRYLAERYHLKNYYILGLSPEEDPSPKTIAKVADAAKQKGVRTIFFETLVSPKLSQTIANEIGAKTAVLNPIEGLTIEELNSSKDYVSVMEENLVQLRAALNCL
jgi:zinc transport system substrate-binding protein